MPSQRLHRSNVQPRMAMEKVQDAIEEIRSRFGKSASTYACLMGEKMPI